MAHRLTPHIAGFAALTVAALLLQQASAFGAAAPEGRSEDAFEHINDDPSWATETNRCAGSDAIESVVYTVNGNAVASLQGNVPADSTVAATFELKDGCENVKLGVAAYTAPDDHWDPAIADKQKLTAQQTGYFSAGIKGSLAIKVPACFFQLDFFTGDVLTSLSATTNYSMPVNNLIAAANGGSKLCDVAPLAETRPVITEVPAQVSETGCPVDASSQVADFSYTINDVPGFATLEANVKPGDRVKVDFTLVRGCDAKQISFTSYAAHDDGSEFFALSENATGIFESGEHSLSVTVPDCYFYISLVYGPALEQIGPMNSSNFYTADQQIDALTGGEACDGTQASVNVLSAQTGYLQDMIETSSDPAVLNSTLASPLAANTSTVASSTQLATTGSDTDQLAILGSGLIALGAGFTILGLIYRRQQ